jgi:hypothetical protein
LKYIRKYLISDTKITVIKHELENIERNMIHTPDTRANYEKIMEILNALEGA